MKILPVTRNFFLLQKISSCGKKFLNVARNFFLWQDNSSWVKCLFVMILLHQKISFSAQKHLFDRNFLLHFSENTFLSNLLPRHMGISHPGWESSHWYQKGLEHVRYNQGIGKTTFDGRPLSMEDNLRWKTTFVGRRPSMEDDLWWKTTFDGRWPMMEDDLW